MQGRGTRISHHSEWSVTTEIVLTGLINFPIITSRKVPLQPDVEADEEVATPHFLVLQLGHSVPAVAPSDGNRGERVAANDGLQGKLYGEIEMG